MVPLFLLIGNKKYSSWSLRAWLALKQSGIPFEEKLVPLSLPDTTSNILKFSPSGRVPFLRHGKIEIWESLAIGEYLAETFPEARLWPKDAATRAHARAVSSEMHAGFNKTREYLPMDVSRDLSKEGTAKKRAQHVQGEIDRIEEIWTECRRRRQADGPFLFGHFTIADAMFSPMVTRFWTYGVKLKPEPAAYVEAIMNLLAMKEWVEDARRESWVIDYPIPSLLQATM